MQDKTGKRRAVTEARDSMKMTDGLSSYGRTPFSALKCSVNFKLLIWECGGRKRRGIRAGLVCQKPHGESGDGSRGFLIGSLSCLPVAGLNKTWCTAQPGGAEEALVWPFLIQAGVSLFGIIKRTAQVEGDHWELFRLKILYEWWGCKLSTGEMSVEKWKRLQFFFCW